MLRKQDFFVSPWAQKHWVIFLGVVLLALILSVFCLCMLVLAGCSKDPQAPYTAEIDEVFVYNTYKGKALVANLNVTNTSKEYIDAYSIEFDMTFTNNSKVYILNDSSTPIEVKATDYMNYDTEANITLTVVDKRHYAKEEIYSQTFTIDELIENSFA